MFSAKVPTAIAADANLLLQHPEFDRDFECDVHIHLGIVKMTWPRSTRLLTSTQLHEVLSYFASIEPPSLFDGYEAPGTLCFEVGLDRVPDRAHTCDCLASFAFPSGIALSRGIGHTYMPNTPNMQTVPTMPSAKPGRRSPDQTLSEHELLRRFSYNKDVILVSEEPFSHETMILATCIETRGETCFLLQDRLSDFLAATSGKWTRRYTCLEKQAMLVGRDKLQFIDPIMSMRDTERTDFCERKLAAPETYDHSVPSPLLDFITKQARRTVDQLDLIDLYFSIAQKPDFDFAELRRALGFVRVVYDRACAVNKGFPRARKIDTYGNDPTPTFILSDNSLCLGGLHHINPYVFKQLGIKAVVSCGAVESSQDLKRAVPDLELLEFPSIRDDGVMSMYPLFARCVQFVEEQRAKGGTTIINCHRAHARSATAVMAYLIAVFKMSADQARQVVRRVRPRVWPTARLWEDLLHWEYTCHGLRQTFTLNI